MTLFADVKGGSSSIKSWYSTIYEVKQRVGVSRWRFISEHFSVFFSRATLLCHRYQPYIHQNILEGRL